MSAEAATHPVEAGIRPAAKTAPARRRRKRHKDNLAAYLFLSPWFLGIFGFVVLPMAYSLYLSLTKFDLLSSPQWVGFDNYLAMWQDDRRAIAVETERTPTLHAALKALQVVRTGHVLRNADGSPVSDSQARDAMYRICRLAGLPERGWHVLRHSFGTHAAMLGVNPWRLQTRRNGAEFLRRRMTCH